MVLGVAGVGALPRGRKRLALWSGNQQFRQASHFASKFFRLAAAGPVGQQYGAGFQP